MLPYWGLFLLAALMAFSERAKIRVRSDGTRSLSFDQASVMMFAVLTVMVGLRFDVGGDWPNYARYIDISYYMSYADAFAKDDPAYWLLNVLATRLGWDIAFVNVVCAVFFALGLLIYCGTMERRWLALACAVPYLITVVGMGYTRQGVAIGFAMIGLAALRRGLFVRFAFWVLVGATFHKSAVILIPLAALLNSRNRFMTFALMVAITGIGYVTLLQDSVEGLVDNYIEAQYQSSGALIRLIMNFVPAVLFLALRRRFVISDYERRLYSLLSYLSIAALLAFFVTPASTALDRLALYLIPLQMFVFANLPRVLAPHPSAANSLVAPIIGYHALILFVWLNFAGNAYAWTPYRSFLW